MKIAVKIEHGRSAHVSIAAEELAAVYLHLAFPDQRNRTDRYLRRHARAGEEPPSPNRPVHSSAEPPKIPAGEHVAQMGRAGLLAPPSAVVEQGNDRFRLEPARLVVPISDLVANLLRPCFHRDGLGPYRVFCFQGEPLDRKTYFSACYFSPQGPSRGRLELRRTRFDKETDRALAADGEDLAGRGLVWAAALVPLVVDGRPLNPVAIAREDYDLRQILGRDSEAEIQDAYRGWFAEWDARVAQAVQRHRQRGRPFGSFYHSVLASDPDNGVHIYQMEGRLPEIAETLAKDGMRDAGLLDSGGSCAVRPLDRRILEPQLVLPRTAGAVLVFGLDTTLRVPADPSNSWLMHHPTVETRER